MDVAPFISQTEQTRCVVQGQLINGGEICTVVLIREREGWVFYPHGATGMGVRIADSEAVTLASTILDNL
ncbi:MAG: hypothetical protein ABR608_05805 [Pseudonocardiaceae bacterium]